MKLGGTGYRVGGFPGMQPRGVPRSRPCVRPAISEPPLRDSLALPPPHPPATDSKAPFRRLATITDAGQAALPGAAPLSSPKGEGYGNPAHFSSVNRRGPTGSDRDTFSATSNPVHAGASQPRRPKGETPAQRALIDTLAARRVPRGLEAAMTACGFPIADIVTVRDVITRRGVSIRVERDAKVPQHVARLAAAEQTHAKLPPLEFTWQLRPATYAELTSEQLLLLTAKAILLATMHVHAQQSTRWPEVIMPLPVTAPDAVARVRIPYDGAETGIVDRGSIAPQRIGVWDEAWVATTHAALTRLVSFGRWLLAAKRARHSSPPPEWLPPALQSNHAQAYLMPLTLLGTTGAFVLHRRPPESTDAQCDVDIETPAPTTTATPALSIDPVQTHLYFPADAAGAAVVDLFSPAAFGRHSIHWPRTCALLRLLERWERRGPLTTSGVDLAPGADTPRTYAVAFGQAVHAMVQHHATHPTALGAAFQAWLGAHRRVVLELVPLSASVPPELTIFTTDDTLLCLVHAAPETTANDLARICGPALLAASQQPAAQSVHVWQDRALHVEARVDNSAAAAAQWATFTGSPTAERTRGMRPGTSAGEFDPRRNPNYLKAPRETRVAYEAALRWFRAHTQSLGDENVPRPGDSRATVKKKRSAVMHRFHDETRPNAEPDLKETSERTTNQTLILHWQAILALYPRPKREAE